jgi:hypothetical protein
VCLYQPVATPTAPVSPPLARAHAGTDGIREGREREWRDLVMAERVALAPEGVEILGSSLDGGGGGAISVGGGGGGAAEVQAVVGHRPDS